MNTGTTLVSFATFARIQSHQNVSSIMKGNRSAVLASMQISRSVVRNVKKSYARVEWPAVEHFIIAIVLLVKTATHRLLIKLSSRKTASVTVLLATKICTRKCVQRVAITS